MKISGEHIKRYKDITLLLWKYGRSDLVRQMNGAEEGFEPPSSQSEGQTATPDQLADDLEAMGPTFVKLGQLLSSRSDLLPEPYLRSLARLQDKVKPFPYQDVEQIIVAELGIRISKAFSHFDPKPVAAASLGQVHVATLRNGREVIVKVQRPDIRRQIATDFEIIGQIVEFLDAHTEFGRRHRLASVFEELRATIQQELNYEREAQNLVTLGENLRDFNKIQIPQPVMDYSTRCVLTMDYVQGHKITTLSPLARLDLDGPDLAEELFKAYLKQILMDGIFHADPHPGNVFLTQDGRVALLDLGMVGHVTPGTQEQLLKLLIAVGDNDTEQASEILIHISQTTPDFNKAEFCRHIGRIMSLWQNQNLQHFNIGSSLLELSRQAVNNGLYVPTQLTLLAKTLLQMDEIGKILDPTFDPQASIRRNASALMMQRFRKSLNQGNIFNSLLDLKHFAAGLPAKMNRLFDLVTGPDLELKIRVVDAKVIVEGFQKIANRITAGIILAALILGAALLMKIQTTFQIFGYPGLAILCFLVAAGGSLWLLFTIFFQDEKIKKKP
jgi:predicted unusual protein kinase regulating ubiquinone biosynthesis (AarF/ABC1/UbiB family)